MGDDLRSIPVIVSVSVSLVFAVAVAEAVSRLAIPPLSLSLRFEI